MPMIEGDLANGDVAEWKATVAQMREVVLRDGVVGAAMVPREWMSPQMKRCLPSQREVDTLTDQSGEAFRTGRIIVFGDIPNDVIMATAKRAGPLYAQRLLPMPFSDPWMFSHGFNGGTSWYLVNPLEEGCFEIAEILPACIKGRNMAAIGDRAMMQRVESGTVEWSKYPCSVVPAPFRYINIDDPRLNNGKTPESAAAGNVLDPIVCCLMILSTNGVQKATIAPAPALARARAKRGKLPIPPYTLVNSDPWVTAISTRAKGARGPDKGGTHASPVAHLRRGHLRTLPTGKRTLIRDSLVNFTEEARSAFNSQRSHYTVET